VNATPRVDAPRALRFPSVGRFPRVHPAGPGSRDTDDHEPRNALAAPRATDPVGLAPADARAWLRLQDALAFEPEKAAPLLRAGWSPEAILGRLETDRASALEASAAGSLFGGTYASSGPAVDATGAAIARLERLAVRIVPLPDPAYPEALRVLEDAPLVLGVRGRAERLARPAIAIVGARAATRGAREFARRLAYDLARAGLTIVSGLARGIDAEAHRGALEAGGSTIGVLACGIDRLYPPEHRLLASEMSESGAIVSELPLGTFPRPLHFPLRNRIISGLARAVVVVEARRRSGSLITVRHALAQGREVFVVPGAVGGPFAEGTNQLLREGARAIQSARDLLEDLGIELGPTPPRSAATLRGAGGIGCEVEPAMKGRVGESGALGGLARQLLARLADGPRTADELLLEAGLDPGRLATVLLELELAGRVAEERDGRIHLCRCAHPAAGVEGGNGVR